MVGECGIPFLPLPKTSLVCVLPNSLNLPPSNLGLPASLLSLSLSSTDWGRSQITPGKLPGVYRPTRFLLGTVAFCVEIDFEAKFRLWWKEGCNSFTVSAMGMARWLHMCVAYLPHASSSLLSVWLPLTSTFSGLRSPWYWVTLPALRLACVWQFPAGALLSLLVLQFLEDIRDSSLHVHYSHNPLLWCCSQNIFLKLPEMPSISLRILPNEWQRQKLNYL